jgi:hypothetical protein
VRFGAGARPVHPIPGSGLCIAAIANLDLCRLCSTPQILIDNNPGGV